MPSPDALAAFMWRTLVATVAALVLASPVFAQPAATPPAGDTAAAAFDAAFDAYKAEIRQIEALRTEYQTADETRREAINEQLPLKIAAAKGKIDVMVEKAIDAFRANPMADKQVTDLLLAIAEHKVVGRGPAGGGDQYESALPILEALVDGGHEKPELPLWGVLSAVFANDFDLADKFAAIAEESGAAEAKPGPGSEAQETYALAMGMLQRKDELRARWEREKAIRDEEAAADNNPRVKLFTNKGDVTIELFEDQAPTAVANFVTLVKDGFYDGVVFHRVIPRFMAQGGDPTGTGTGGPGYSIACECSRPDARQHFRGTLSMAHAGRDTGGSQFFLCFMPTEHLDGQHTVFGTVIDGWDVLGELQVIDPRQQGAQPDRIEKAEVLRDRGHAYEFKKLPGR